MEPLLLLLLLVVVLVVLVVVVVVVVCCVVVSPRGINKRDGPKEKSPLQGTKRHKGSGDLYTTSTTKTNFQEQGCLVLQYLVFS